MAALCFFFYLEGPTLERAWRSCSNMTTYCVAVVAVVVGSAARSTRENRENDALQVFEKLFQCNFYRVQRSLLRHPWENPILKEKCVGSF